MIDINDKNWKEQLSGNPLLAIKFGALWCGPCKIIKPIVEELAKEYEGKIAFSNVDVDNNPELSNEFGIRNVPTILFFKNGKIVDKQVGATTKSALDKKIQEFLK